MSTSVAPPASSARTAPRAADAADFTVASSGQWLCSTDGRIAPHGDAWLEAVIWFHEHSKYQARDRAHGPRRVGDTTLRVARAMAHLKVCRPGVARLMEWLKLSERTIQYHLRILRETGLLTYGSKGTRIAGVGGRASEFLRTIPRVFDEAVGLRTGPSDRLIRSVRGLVPEGIPLMKKLYRKARRPVTRKRTKLTNRRAGQTASAQSACTPMVVSTSRLSSAGDLSFPPENKLGGTKQTTTEKSPRRKLNRTGRRFQLAGELIQRVGWLHRASVARIAWIVRHVADTGWTADEVIALLSQLAPAQRVNRPSGFLAYRLGSAHQLYDTPAKRAVLVEVWRDSSQAAAQRHAEWSGEWQAPSSRALSRQVNEAFACLRPKGGEDQSLESLALDEDGQADLTQLTREEVIDLRSAALRDPALVETAIEMCGESYARRLYTHHLVDQVLRLRGTGRLVLHAGGGTR
ncbi:transcriptional regulator [Streptomyces europaeiscabiei]|uniref:transcriptional regulator n=1 Tax=Streptomyces europaeiscabiei TaxID=146819 RepID=UPI0029A8DC08|nr:transcriptional regulator [Streptomyces europaeiscabiei]MDX3694841.1 transcriptional regulator [Streptomyces europaeiscabiei]